MRLNSKLSRQTGGPKHVRGAGHFGGECQCEGRRVLGEEPGPVGEVLPGVLRWAHVLGPHSVAHQGDTEVLQRIPRSPV